MVHSLHASFPHLCVLLGIYMCSIRKTPCHPLGVSCLNAQEACSIVGHVPRRTALELIGFLQSSSSQHPSGQPTLLLPGTPAEANG